MPYSFVTPWSVVYQAPLSIGFSRQEYWSGLPFSSSGDLPNSVIKPTSPALQADSLPLSHEESTINMVLYLEKDLKFALEVALRKVAACVIVKWCKRVYPKWEGKLYLSVWMSDALNP